MSEMEDRLRAALSARAELVQPEHLAPLAPAVERISAFEGLAAHEATATIRIDDIGRHSGAFDGTPAVNRGR